MDVFINTPVYLVLIVLEISKNNNVVKNKIILHEHTQFYSPHKNK